MCVRKMFETPKNEVKLTESSIPNVVIGFSPQEIQNIEGKYRVYVPGADEVQEVVDDLKSINNIYCNDKV